MRREKDGLALTGMVCETGWKPSLLQPLISSLVQQGKILQAGDSYISAEAFARVRGQIITVLEAFHKANPLVAGISKEELRTKLALQQGIVEALFAQLVREKKVEVSGEQVRLAGRGV